MNYVAAFMSVFSVLGGIDYLLGNRFGLGKEFEKGFMMLGLMSLSMIGMIIAAPVLGDLMEPFSNFVYTTCHIDPSSVTSMVFSSDMGGAPLAKVIARDETLGIFNGLVVGSMMGATISFTIPVALTMISKENHKYVLTGFMCGIITIPIGCFVSGLMMKIALPTLLLNLLPMVIFSIIISLGLAFIPDISVKIFSVLGKALTVFIILCLLCGIVKFLTGIEVVKGLLPIEDGAKVCLNATVVMSGAFPFLSIVSRLITRQIKALGNKLGISGVSAFGLFSSLATNVNTFESIDRMDKKGIVLNSAFAISAAFLFAGHLAFTLSFNSDYVFHVMAGKAVSGICALILAIFVCSKRKDL